MKGLFNATAYERSAKMLSEKTMTLSLRICRSSAEVSCKMDLPVGCKNHICQRRPGRVSAMQCVGQGSGGRRPFKLQEHDARASVAASKLAGPMGLSDVALTAMHMSCRAERVAPLLVSM